MDSTVRADSSFRHFSNALKKRGYMYAAGYAAAAGTTCASGVDHAATVWQLTKDILALQEMLEFFVGVCDEPPAALRDALTLANRGTLVTSEKIERIHFLVPDPFDLIDGDSLVELTLTKAEARELENAIASVVPSTPIRGSARRKLVEAVSA